MTRTNTSIARRAREVVGVLRGPRATRTAIVRAITYRRTAVEHANRRMSMRRANAHYSARPSVGVVRRGVQNTRIGPSPPASLGSVDLRHQADLERTMAGASRLAEQPVRSDASLLGPASRQTAPLGRRLRSQATVASRVLQKALQFVDSHVRVCQDVPQGPLGEIAAGVNGHCGTAAVRMPHDVMTSGHSGELETGSL